MAGKKNRTALGITLLMAAAIIWGFSFVVQNIGLEECPALTFNGTRMLIGGFALIPVISVMDAGKRKKQTEIVAWTDKTLLKGGLVCGICITVGSILQTYGLVYTTPGKSGFVTALYVLFVPVFYFLIFRFKTEKKIWFCVVLALAGMYFLCLTGDSGVNIGDVLTFFCAIGYSFHIISIDRFSPKTDAVKLSSYQFIFCGFASLIPGLLIEHPTAASIKAALFALLYSGFLSTGVAFTFQVIAIPMLNPVVATILSSFESVFALVGGMIILRDIPTLKEGLGCIMMFSALIIAQIPSRKKKE